MPMRIYPAVHYVMGGLWVDYDLQSTIPGLFVTGEANFSDHGANRLGASALMQGLADGYFVLPNTIRDYLAEGPFDKVPEDHPAVRRGAAVGQGAGSTHFLNTNGTRSVDSYHRELGNIMWEYCGMERTEDGLKKAIDLIRTLKDDFWRNVKVLGTAESLNQSLEKAGRVADFLELGELMCIDALNRRESCGGHFRAESQTEDGEALRHDDQYAYVAAWEWAGEGEKPGPAQGEPDLRVRRDEAEDATSETEADAQDLAPAERGRRRRACTPTSSTTSPPDMSFLEMLDVLNEQLNAEGEEPVAFDSDCREGICGMCGLMINGEAHGPEVTTTCQLHMRSFKDGDDDHDRAVARRRVPGDQGPLRRPRRLRPDHPARRLHLGQHRCRPRRPRDAGAEGQGRPGLRRRHLHRLRRLRRGLPQRLGVAVRRRQDHPPRRAAPGPGRAGQPRGQHGRPARRTRASAAAPTSASAPPPAPRRSRST